MIQQQILAIPPAVQLEVDRLNEQIERASHAELVGLVERRDALLQHREPRPIGIGERF